MAESSTDGPSASDRWWPKHSLVINRPDRFV
jgi:hypothetical protein